jgi:hypothetical protein
MRSNAGVLGWLFLCAGAAACGSGPAQTLVGNNGAGDTIIAPTPPPPDTVAPPDSLPPPPDSTAPPDSSSPEPPPVIIPVHVGIPFGPYALPPDTYGQEFTGTYRPRWNDRSLLADLEAARRANTRVLLNLTGSERYLSDENGFSFAKWKARVDQHRNTDISSYIADGTVVAHFIMDEPDDPSNWGGKTVSLADIDMVAKYSKEIWPDLPTVIRVTPGWLKGYKFQYLDGAWAQYLDRFGPLDSYIATNIRDAKESGLALVGGLNVLNGGSKNSGIPGRKAGKFAMSANEIRTWGTALLAQPYFCAFIMWEYDQAYFSRPDIKAALAELRQQAAVHPQQGCRKS